jgi:hypothetical protein
VPQYDDSVYFGSAVRLVDGFLPYRDFALVQPPGISLLLTPVALLAKITGTDAGLAMARILTACAGAASVALGGMLVRQRGLLAVALACAILALHPDASGAAQSVFLEPWLVLFCLLGLLAAFDGDRLSGQPTRMAWSGAAFGAALAVKAWAVIPAFVLLLALACSTRARRRSALTFTGGFAAALGVTVLPFFLAAPKAFIDNVVIAQLSRVDAMRTGVVYRLRSLFGLTDLSLSNDAVIAAAVGTAIVIAASCVGAAALSRRRPTPLQSFVLANCALALLMFLWPVDYYVHYAAFFAVFLALALSLSSSRLIAVIEKRSRPRAATWRLPPVPLAALAALGLIALIVAAARVVIQHEAQLKGAGRPTAQARVIPAGSCVLTDYPALTIAGDRFESTKHPCPAMVDAIGTDYALSHGRNALTGAGRAPAVTAAWLTAFRQAQYVWLSCGPPQAHACDIFTNRRIPWTPTILAYFYHHYHRLRDAAGYIYARDRAN